MVELNILGILFGLVGTVFLLRHEYITTGALSLVSKKWVAKWHQVVGVLCLVMAAIFLVLAQL